MILDKVFHGVLDQGRGCLLVFDEPEADVISLPCTVLLSALTDCVLSQNTYGAAIDTLEQVGKVVDSLYAKVRRWSRFLARRHLDFLSDMKYSLRRRLRLHNY
jgi:26S proteasome regulatory subunit N6